MSKEIPLSRGLVAIVDDEDFEWLNRWKWCASVQGKPNAPIKKFRAFRMEWLEGGRQRGILMHRAIMTPGPGEVVDHVNGKPLDNRRINLRVVSQKENSVNRVGWNSKDKRFKGVSWHKGGGKWIASFRGQYLGLFVDEEDAARAYNKAATHHGGEIPLNEVGDKQ